MKSILRKTGAIALIITLAMSFTSCLPAPDTTSAPPENSPATTEEKAPSERPPANTGADYAQKIFSIVEVGIAREHEVDVAVAMDNADAESVAVNNNAASFTDAQCEKALGLNDGAGWIALSELDEKARAGRALSLIDENTLPTEKRKSLSYKPSGWPSPHKKVMIEGKSLWFYNRSHLVAYMLSGLNDEPRNLITGAAKMNTPVMERMELSVRDYVKNTDNAVLYEVTPIYKDGEVVARGVQIRYQSIDLGIEDDEELEANVYLYNKNPGWVIDYATGGFSEAA